MTNKTIFDLLVLVEGDVVPDWGSEDTRYRIENWSDLALNIIKRLQTTSRLGGLSPTANVSAEAAKEALFDIKSVLDRYVHEHENSGY